MKILGIDFGSKRVGIAVANTETGVAFPKAVLPNDKFLLGEVKSMIASLPAEIVVIGESKNFAGEKNPIMKEIEMFKKLIEIDTGIEVIYEPEFFSSAQAIHGQEDTKMLDASAATIILQSYLDKQKNKNGK